MHSSSSCFFNTLSSSLYSNVVAHSNAWVTQSVCGLQRHKFIETNGLLPPQRYDGVFECEHEKNELT